MHTAAADIGYAMKRNTTIGPSPPRTPPGGQKGPHPEAFPMPDRPRASPAGPPGGEWEAAPLSPVMEHDDEGGARAAPRHRARVECVVLDGGSRLERFEADRAPPPTPEGLTPAKSLSPGAGKKIPNVRPPRARPRARLRRRSGDGRGVPTSTGRGAADVGRGVATAPGCRRGPAPHGERAPPRRAATARVALRHAPPGPPPPARPRRAARRARGRGGLQSTFFTFCGPGASIRSRLKAAAGGGR